MTNANATNTTPRRGVVLVSLALDGTSDWALLEGARLARERNDSELHVVHAVQMPNESLGAFDQRLDAVPVEIQRRIEALWVNGEPLQVIAHLGSGDAARLILQTAADLEADVIVVGSHQRSGLQRLVLGSVSEAVMQGARCSVMVALPHDYSGADKPKHVDPPCAACVEARKRSEGASYWCTRHGKDYVTPHIYRPRVSASAAARNSIPGML